MKNLKFYFTIGCIVLAANVFSQKKATYKQVGSKEVKGKISEYISENGTTFQVGDTLKVGVPFRNNQFSYLMDKTMAYLGEAVYLSPQSVGEMCVIKSMKTSQRNLYVTTYGEGESKALIISNFEEAFTSGEIEVPNLMNSDLALKELKKAKEKLDLELISQEEYNALKIELMKYIE
ncbi:hypothetical protein [Carboxylicivirga marina]|uniref:hypothetical protein n=1 Tax=Carboxylicivirga marina TaxID=2800988 RepID=UPI0025939BFB|nr:hypothetical protein [uncultured Carboxylicivirga sp.]